MMGFFCFWNMALWYLVTRFYSFARYGAAGFGYDTGIYRHFAQGYFARFGDASITPFGFSGYTTSLRFLGASTDTIIFTGYIFLSLLLAVLFYFWVKQWHAKSAWFAAALSTTSIVQYNFFVGYFYRNFLALFFSLIIFYLIKAQSKLVWLPIATLLIIHPLTAVPVGITLILYSFLAKEEQKFIWTHGIIGGILGVILNWPEFALYLPFLSHQPSSINLTSAEATGLFMPAKDFLYAILWYVPLAIFGITNIDYKKYYLPIIFLLANSFLALAQVFFYQRFFVSIDLILILFAGIGLSVIWSFSKHWRAMIIIYVTVFTVFSGKQIVTREPLIKPIELQAITQIQVPKEARILTVNSHYAPWLYGFTEYGIIAPGLFEYNAWDEKTWNTFRNQANAQKRADLLKIYNQKPVYIFTGDRDDYFRVKLAEDPNVKQVNEYLWQVLY